MSKGSLNLQDSFLNQVRRESILIRVTLLDGREFRGRVKGFDNFTLVVVGENNDYHLIYKHAIGQIVSPKPIHGTTSRRHGIGQEGDEASPEEAETAGESSDQTNPAHDANQGPAAADGEKKRKIGFNPIRFDSVQPKKGPQQ